MPTATDLVTDLPADFEVFGQAVDTRLKALQPGTTLGDLAYSSATANTNTRLPIGTNGQVLAVVAGVPAWQNGTTGDIEGVTAGVGISGGGTSGTVTVTNSMATAIDAKGDLIAGTGADAFTRVAVGTNGQLLQADSTAAGGVSWVAAPAAGSMTLLSTTSLSGLACSGPSITGISGSYTNLLIVIVNAEKSGDHNVEFSWGTNNNHFITTYGTGASTGSLQSYSGVAGFVKPVGSSIVGSSANYTSAVISINRYATTDSTKQFEFAGGFYNAGWAGNNAFMGGGRNLTSGAISSFQFRTEAQTGTWSGGTIYIYGVN
jgi:hypothetical protein